VARPAVLIGSANVDVGIAVGDGAGGLASEIGLEFESLLTEHSEQVWREGPAGRAAADPEHAPGTVNVLALLSVDGSHAGVSTETGKTYVYWQSGMATFATAPRVLVGA
jgi:hypothetical protein